MDMTMDAPYSKREQDEFRQDVKESLSKILMQTTQHNHRMTKIERAMLIVGTATTILIVTKFPELKPLLGLI